MEKRILIYIASMLAALTLCAQDGTVYTSLAPLKKASTTLAEGRNILLDQYSYPRQPKQLVGPVQVTQLAQGGQIDFELSGFDDVEVVILNEADEVIRRLGAGVLGDNAPEPFQKNSLQQSLVWDGTTASGQLYGGVWKARVSVGFAADFEQFVGYSPTQLSAYICGMEVDSQGRVYVSLHTDNHGDYNVLRFDRQGTYLEQVHPPNPEGWNFSDMKAQWKYTQLIEGKPVPSRLHAEQFWIWRWAGWQPFPLRIARDDSAYIFETDTGWWNGGYYFENGYRWWEIDDLERFWFTPTAMVLFGRNNNGIALDDNGHVFFGARSLEQTMKSLPPRGYHNRHALGRIQKVNLASGNRVAAFTYNGLTENSSPREYLGHQQELSSIPDFSRTSPDSSIDSHNRFVDICGMDVDDDGNILVADGFPRRLKIYRSNGRYVGEIDSVNINGVEQGFWNITGLRCSGDDFYLLATTRPSQGEDAVLVKFTGDPASPQQVWVQPLDGTARYVAVDDFGSETILWVGNGAGQYTFSRIVDNGSQPGEIQHFGGKSQDTFIQPLEFAAADEDELFVFDFARKQIIKTNDQGDFLATVDTPVWEGREENYQNMESERHRPYEYDLGQISSIRVDRNNGRLMVGYGNRKRQNTPQFEAYDLNLNPDSFTLEALGNEGIFSTEGWGVIFSGSDQDGNIYVYDKLASMYNQRIRPLSWGEGWYGGSYGAIRKYDANGNIVGEVAKLFHPCGSVSLDSKGNIYAIDMAKSSYENALFYFPHYKDGYTNDEVYDQSEGYERTAHFTRDGEPVLYQSAITYLVKFPPTGGERDTQSELWAHRGVGNHSSEGCYCDMPGNLLAIDDADRIYVTDAANYVIKVMDPAGNLLAKIGGYGNAETVAAAGGNAYTGFRNFHCIDAVGDVMYVSDKDLRRIAKFRSSYREVQTVSALPPEIPLAHAGADQSKTDSDWDGSEWFTLDASASRDNLGIVSYLWLWNGEEVSTDPQPQIQVPLGVHELELQVRDADDNLGSDRVTLTVREPQLNTDQIVTVEHSGAAVAGEDGDTLIQMNLENTGGPADYLLVTVLSESGDFQPASYAGQNMTPLLSVAEGNGFVRFFGLKNPAASGQLRLTLDPNAGQGRIWGGQIVGWMYLSGVDQTQPLAASDQQTSVNGTASLTLDAAGIRSGDLTVTSVNGNDQQQITFSPTGSLLFDDRAGVSFDGAIHWVPAASATHTTTVSFPEQRDRQVAGMVVLQAADGSESPEADEDDDGLPDVYETARSGSATGLDATADLDNDGFTELEEWVARTDPLDRYSYFFVRTFAVEENGITISWNSAAGRVYEIRYRASLDAEPVTIASDLQPTPPFNYFLDEERSQNSGGFYQVGVKIAPAETD